MSAISDFSLEPAVLLSWSNPRLATLSSMVASYTSISEYIQNQLLPVSKCQIQHNNHCQLSFTSMFEATYGSKWFGFCSYFFWSSRLLILLNCWKAMKVRTNDIGIWNHWKPLTNFFTLLYWRRFQVVVAVFWGEPDVHSSDH